LQELKEIGKGGFGVVHEVIADDGTHYARKTYCVVQNFPNTPETDAIFLPRFLREAKLQSGIEHKNVVPIFQKNLNASPPYFLMPLAESTLERDLLVDKSLGGNFLAAIMDILAALEEIHPLRIYHRDLKPGNVLRFCDPNDPRGHYYAISDFGLVALKQTQVSVLTQLGMKMTSDFYTAPEITTDLSKASSQSDIYSVGCILHDMVGIESRVPCSEIKEHGDFEAILQTCTRRDPARRFKSVSILRDVLLDIATQHEPMTTAAGDITINILASDEVLNETHWNQLIDIVDHQPDSMDARQLLRALTFERLDQLLNTYPILWNKLGRLYSDWIRDGSFDFGECDGLANRLEGIFNQSDLEVQAEALMALLYMGTSHNRWYVERKFLSLSNAMSPLLAKRLAIAFRADDNRACLAIDRLESSIKVNRAELHPVLISTLQKMCT
jgi:serine/threonine protein kinase